MRDAYHYPAILTYDVDGISIEFPDLPGCLSCAETSDKAAKNAREALELHMWSMEKDNDDIPLPTDISKIPLKEKQIPLLVEAYMPVIRDRISNHNVKKTLSIPAWLNRLAEREKVNFSRVLQDGLKRYLSIQD